jgi:cytochrome c biogenesis factor
MNLNARLGVSLIFFRSTYQQVRRSRFASDKLSVGLVVGSLLISTLTFISLLLTVHPTLQGAVRFSSLNVGYTLGVWYYPYLIAAFGLSVVVVNTILAYRVHGRSRMASFFLLAGSEVVVIFCLIIANALGAAK